MFQNLHPKCANPSCVTAFDWFGGGRLFRFRREPIQLATTDAAVENSDHSHHVEHFWLCERCSLVYTLNYEPGRGVLIRLLWPAIPEGKTELLLPHQPSRTAAI